MAAQVVTGLLALTACGAATSEASPRAKPVEVDIHTPILETRRPQVMDPNQWFSSRGVSGPTGEFGDSGGCVELVVGTAREHALLCDEMEEFRCDQGPACWVFTHSIVRVVRAGKIVPVLDVKTQVLGFDTGPPPFVEVRLSVAANGMSATISDSPEERTDDCKGVGIDADKNYLAARRRVCVSRGAFRWKRDRFVRVR